MDIYLYVNTEPKNKIGKKLTEEFKLIGTLRNETSITDPTIIVESEKPINYNYLYIPEFSRSYFINNMRSIRTNLWELQCHVDVLNSFDGYIKNVPVIVNNSTNLGSTYLNGDVWVTNVKESTSIINFSGGLSNTGEFILITAGG